ncbi:MAG: CBS domain-containing protein [Proteobacteria bacterium]|nr:CBS domain-containing protein [Pseudomonadota bacterium]
MQTAGEVMQEARSVSPTLSVQDLARLLLEEQLDGVCVVAEDGALVGVVTSMDLIFQEKQLHLPTFFMLLDGVLPLDAPWRAERELDKISGAEVADIMTADPVAVAKDTPLDQVATLMVERHISILPVVADDRLIGVVTKPAMLRAAFSALAAG